MALKKFARMRKGADAGPEERETWIRRTGIPRNVN